MITGGAAAIKDPAMLEKILAMVQGSQSPGGEAKPEAGAEPPAQ